MKDNNELKQKLIMKTGECFDLYRQKNIVNDLAEEFDENIGTYYPDKWLNMSKMNGTGIEKFDNIINGVESLLQDFEELYDEIESECKQLWYQVLAIDKSELKKEFIANIEEYTFEQIEQAIDKAFDEMSVDKCEYNVEKTTGNFVDCLKEQLK